MTFQIQYTNRDYIRIIVLGFLGVVLVIHGALILLSLYSRNSLFLLDTLVDSLGSISEVVVGLSLVFLGFFPDEVVEFFTWVLDSAYIR